MTPTATTRPISTATTHVRTAKTQTNERTTMSTTLIESATAERDATQAQIDALLAKPATENRSALTEAEKAEFDTLVAKRNSLHSQVTDLAAEEQTRANIAGTINSAGLGTASVTVKSEPGVYRKGDPNSPSFFRDLFKHTYNMPGAADARQRLEANTRGTIAEMQARAINTTDGTGGDFAPPLWQVDEFVALARGGCVAANLATSKPLPGGTDQVNLPKIATGTATAEQTTQNTALQNTDATTGTALGQVTTVGGIQILAQQLLDQSPINMDEVILQDLAADYAVKLDTLFIAANSAGKRGLLNIPSEVAVTYTDASPAVLGSGKLWGKIADAIQQVHTSRFIAPTAILMAPRRWAWFLAAADTTGRPVVAPGNILPQVLNMNGIGSLEAVASVGLVGTLQGLPVYVDPNIPTNLGAGTNEDRIIIAKWDDLYLYESTPRAEVFRETKADQASVLVRFYNYAAILTERFPKAVAVISGTGLVTPTY